MVRGSLTPLVSTIMWSTPQSRTFSIECSSSPLIVQHTQPLESSTRASCPIP